MVYPRNKMNFSANNQGHRIHWWHSLLFFVCAMGIQVIMALLIVVARAFGLFGKTPDEVAHSLLSPEVVSVQVAITSTALTALAITIPRLFQVQAFSWLHLQKPGAKLVAAALIGVIGVGFLVDEAVFWLHSLSPSLFDDSGLDSFNRIFASAHPLSFVALTIVVSLGPGIGEEFFFRGFVLRAFLSDWPPWCALLASSFLFGIMHIDPLQSTGAGLIGLFLGFVVIRSGSIWPGVVAHALNNLTCALFARYGAEDTNHVWNHGHPPVVLFVAFCLTAFSVVTILKLTSRARKNDS